MEVHAVTLAGKDRIALGSGGGLTIFDISRAGRWLGAREDVVYRVMVMAPGAKAERDLSWLDASKPIALSRDGKTLLFSDFSSAAGSELRRLYPKDRRLARSCVWEKARPGISHPMVSGLSEPFLRRPPRPPSSCSIPRARASPAAWRTGDPGVRLGGVFSRRKAAPRLRHRREADVALLHPGDRRRQTAPVTSEGAASGFVSPDGKQILVQGIHDEYRLYPSDGGDPRRRRSPRSRRTTSSRAGRRRERRPRHPMSEVPGRLDRVDLETGRRTSSAASLRRTSPASSGSMPSPSPETKSPSCTPRCSAAPTSSW